MVRRPYGAETHKVILESGKQILHYRLVDKIGEGGMGVVWKAVDTTLDREVAVKVLPEAVAHDEERLARFEREAKLLASLNHPNIAAVYGLHESDGVRFLAMELVPGEDLTARLARGPLPVEESARIALQVAEALEGAHENGVIHRDLKPANIRVTADGKVKVLDFGLAKAFEAAAPGSQDASLSPTLTSMGTRAGMILGTAAYMSPEQASGQPVDKRCDVWSFGVVLYEMLAGRRLFEGETVSHTLADVLRTTIDWNVLSQDVPLALRRLLRRCLDRETHRRLRDIGEARVALSDVLSGAQDEDAASTAPVAGPASGGSRRLPWLLAAVAGVVAVASLVVALMPQRTPEPQVGRFVLHSPYSGSQRQGDGRLLAISPDGRRVVSVGAGGTDDLLYVRDLDDFEARPIAGTNSARLPFFAPSGDWLGFVTTEGFWKANLGGGPPVEIGTFAAFPIAATWAPDGFIYFASSGELWKIPSAGGTSERVVAEDNAPGRIRDPAALPGGRALLLSVGASTRQPGRLLALTLADGEFKELGLQGTDPRYLSTGHLLYVNGEQLYVVGFDPRRLEPTGSPVPVLPRALVETGTMQGDVGADGTVVYLPKRAGESRRLVLVDREGQAQPVVSGTLPFPDSNDPRFSPDGRKLVISVGSGPLWVIDIESETPTMISESAFYPVWSEDSTMLIYGSVRGRSFDLYRRRIDLSDDEEILLDRENNLRAGDWALGGPLVYREEIPGKGMDLFVWPDLADESTIRPLLDGPDDELSPAVSRDGRWLAYVSSQSGRDEIYVTTFPEPGGRVQVSVAGGTSPCWAPDGKTLYYFERENFVAAHVVTEPGFRVVKRETLFSGNYTQYRWQRQYDVHPDGKRFAMVENPPGGDMEVIVNWFAEVRRLAVD